MRNIKIGVSKPKGFFGYFKNPEFFIEVPVDRNICVSSYLINVTWERTIFRLADRFYDDNRIVSLRKHAVSLETERALIDWGKTNSEMHNLQNFKKELLDDILKLTGKRRRFYEKIF